MEGETGSEKLNIERRGVPNDGSPLWLSKN